MSIIRNTSNILSTAFSSGNYRHVALSISGSTHILYLDGSAVAVKYDADNIFSIYTSTIQNLYIGCASDLSYGYTGSIDDFKIWNRALTAYEINAVGGTNTNTNLITNYLFTSVNASNQTPNTATGSPVYDFSVPVNSINTTPSPYPSFIGTTSLKISNNNSYLINIPNATASYTVGVWFYMTSYGLYTAVLSCGTTDGFNSGTIMAYSGGSNIQMYSPGTVIFANIQNVITMNTWGFLSWSVTPSGTNSSVSILLQYYGATSPTYSNTTTVTGLYTAPYYFRLGQQMLPANTNYTSSGYFSNFQYYNTAYTLSQMANLFNSNSIN
jgi:hypothetical protein